jgi:hypothetical protein
VVVCFESRKRLFLFFTPLFIPPCGICFVFDFQAFEACCAAFLPLSCGGLFWKPQAAVFVFLPPFYPALRDMFYI